MSIFDERYIGEPEQIQGLVSHLRTGNLIDFQLNSAVPLRMKFKLVGFDIGNFFIFSVPSSSYKAHAEELNAGHGCVVRAVIGGDLGHCIAFQSKVMMLQKTPRPLLFVSWPQQVENFRLRKELRVGTRIPATFMDKENGQSAKGQYHLLEGTVMDLSVGGCLFQLPWTIQAGAVPISHGLLKMTFPSRPDDPLFVPAQVRRATRKSQEHMHLGLQFEPVEELIELFHHINLESRL
ncbi:PilZ domain-containing protein [Neiella sp. HB171785]|uniref:PilZ domain-containing protein n=1 Tax=Neiella litorisoli TaxID=2771431 RepID=A0A8J6QTE2_9GAMM|nr:PilZ domain-containing protein [Neiella litorisoli]